VNLFRQVQVEHATGRYFLTLVDGPYLNSCIEFELPTSSLRRRLHPIVSLLKTRPKESVDSDLDTVLILSSHCSLDCFHTGLCTTFAQLFCLGIPPQPGAHGAVLPSPRMRDENAISDQEPLSAPFARQFFKPPDRQFDSVAFDTPIPHSITIIENFRCVAGSEWVTEWVSRHMIATCY